MVSEKRRAKTDLLNRMKSSGRNQSVEIVFGSNVGSWHIHSNLPIGSSDTEATKSVGDGFERGPRIAKNSHRKEGIYCVVHG